MRALELTGAGGNLRAWGGRMGAGHPGDWLSGRSGAGRRPDRELRLAGTGWLEEGSSRAFRLASCHSPAFKGHVKVEG